MTQRWGIFLSKSDTRGQDLIEYALMLGFVAVAAGAVLPGAASTISALFSQIGSVVRTADSADGDTPKPQQTIEVPCATDREPAQADRPAPTCNN